MREFICRCGLRLTIALIMLVAAPAGRGMQARGQGGADTGTTPVTYRSPHCLMISPRGAEAYVCDVTAASLVILDTEEMTKRSEIPLRGRPAGIATPRDDSLVYVAEWGAASVAVVDVVAERVVARIDVGKWPAGLALAEKSQRLYVCNQDLHTVSVVDLTQNPPRVVREVDVIREPVRAAVTPDEQQVVVVNLLARGVGTDPTLSAEVSILDAASLEQTATVKLPPGSTMARGVCLSPDVRWAYVVHGLGRFHLPITQLERGWRGVKLLRQD